MIHKLIQQFSKDVAWGDLDILLVDLPPGTGDAPLSLSQVIPLSGAVMVSMPQHISLIDVHRGISMFEQVKVPILGVVENMSAHVCTSCGHEESIFDSGRVTEFCKQLGLTFLGDIPLDGRIRLQSDKGRPFLLDHSETPAGTAIQAIAKRLEPYLQRAEEEEIRIVI